MFVAELISQELHEKLNRDCEVSDDESKHLPYKLELQTEIYYSSPILLLRQRLATHLPHGENLKIKCKGE